MKTYLQFFAAGGGYLFLLILSLIFITAEVGGSIVLNYQIACVFKLHTYYRVAVL